MEVIWLQKYSILADNSRGDYYVSGGVFSLKPKAVQGAKYAGRRALGLRPSTPAIVAADRSMTAAE